MKWKDKYILKVFKHIIKHTGTHTYIMREKSKMEVKKYFILERTRDELYNILHTFETQIFCDAK